MFLPSTLLMTTLFWAFGVIPIIVLHKSHLTGEHINTVSLNLWSYPYTAISTPSSSHSQRFKVAISKSSTVHTLSVYILTRIFISTLHIIFGHIFEGSPRSSGYFGVFVKSSEVCWSWKCSQVVPEPFWLLIIWTDIFLIDLFRSLLNYDKIVSVTLHIGN